MKANCWKDERFDNKHCNVEALQNRLSMIDFEVLNFKLISYVIGFTPWLSAFCFHDEKYHPF